MSNHPDKRAIDNGTAASAYSPAVVANGLCWVSGQGGLDPETRQVVPGGIQAETKQAIRNLEAILKSAGLTLNDVVSVTCYLRDNDDWSPMSQSYSEAFSNVDVLPARTAVTVAGLPFGLSLEITAVAAMHEH